MDASGDKSQTRDEFKEKLKSLQFGIVKGGYRATNSKTYYDKESLPDFPSKQEVMDYRSDIKNAPVKEMQLEGKSVHPTEG